MISIVLVIFVLVVIILAGILYFKEGNNLNKNLETIAIILNSKVERSWPLYWFTIKGQYKEREIQVSGGYSSSGLDISINFEINMTPRDMVKKQNILVLRLAKPTENTYIKGRNVFYNNTYAKIASKAIKDKSYYIDIFEELRKATAIVETGSPYYRE
ncbi:MAG: hypothetical protein WC491_03215 [Candidatus Omnitrophota bacterium]|jgi:hypothetical protein